MNDMDIVAEAAASPAPCDESRHGSTVGAIRLAAIVDLANQSPRMPAEFGGLLVNSTFEVGQDIQYVQFSTQSPSRPDCVEYRIFTSFDDAVSVVSQERADGLIDALLRLRHRSGGTPGGLDLRASIELMLAPAAVGTSPARIVGTTLTARDTDEGFTTNVEIETIGHDLRTNVERILAWSRPELEDALGKLVIQHVARDELRRRAADIQAVGWISTAALQIVDASGMARAEVLPRLREQQEIGFHFTGTNGREHRARLYWEDGVILGNVECPDDDWCFEAGRLSMRLPKYPETVLTAMIGRRIGVVVEQRFIPPDATITDLDDGGDGWLTLDLEISNLPIDQKSGLLSRGRLVALDDPG